MRVLVGLCSFRVFGEISCWEARILGGLVNRCSLLYIRGAIVFPSLSVAFPEQVDFALSQETQSLEHVC